MPKKKNIQEDKPKVAPDAVNDEDTKQYGSPDMMEAIDAVLGLDDDNGIQLDEQEQRAQQQEESKITNNTQNKKEIQEKDDDSEEDLDKPERESKETERQESEKTDKPEKEEKSEPEFKLSESAEKALKPYSGDLSEKIDQLVKSNNHLNAEIAKLQNIQNTLDALGWKSLKQHEIAATMKELKVAADLMQNDFFFDLAEGILTNNIPKELKLEEKVPQDFMPEEAEFDYNEALRDKRSYSYEAYKKWEDHKKKTNQQVESLLAKTKEGKQKVGDLQSQVEAGKRKLQDFQAKLKQSVIDEYDISESKFEEIWGKIQAFDLDLFKIAFAVEARRNGVKSKALKKIEENRDKVFAESITETVEEGQTGYWEVDKKLEKIGETTFADWDSDDNRVY